jgi:hypothetical protein
VLEEALGELLHAGDVRVVLGNVRAHLQHHTTCSELETDTVRGEEGQARLSGGEACQGMERTLTCDGESTVIRNCGSVMSANDKT